MDTGYNSEAFQVQQHANTRTLNVFHCSDEKKFANKELYASTFIYVYLSWNETKKKIATENMFCSLNVCHGNFVMQYISALKLVRSRRSEDPKTVILLMWFSFLFRFGFNCSFFLFFFFLEICNERTFISLYFHRQFCMRNFSVPLLWFCYYAFFLSFIIWLQNLWAATEFHDFTIIFQHFQQILMAEGGKDLMKTENETLR